MSGFSDFVSPEDENPARLREKAFDFDDKSSQPPARGTFDWRDEGIRFRIRNQRDWNSCTSFALVAMVEGRRQLAGRANATLSAAYIHCCLAGISDRRLPLNPQAASSYCAQHGIAQADDENMPVSQSRCGQLGARTVMVPNGGYEAASGSQILDLLVAQGPILVDLYVSRDFDELKEHTIYEPTPGAGSLLHSMCLVGYDYPARTALLLNSMGADWGNAGYASIRFGTGNLLDRFPFSIPVA